MSINDYGALLSIDGIFINKFSSRFMRTPRTVPDHGYYKGAPRDIYDNYMIYAGQNKLYGLWVLIYGTEITVIYDCQFVDIIDASDDFSYIENGGTYQYSEHTRKEDIDIELYLERLCQDTVEDRFFLAFKATDQNGNNHNFSIIFGLGITPEEDSWLKNLENPLYNFTEDEKKEIKEWFA